MVRKTSIETYEKIMKNGLLSKLKAETYSALYQFGPCTAGELFYKAGWHHSKNNHNISSRLGELRDRGCVDEVGERPDAYSNNTQIVWQTNDNEPVKLEKPKQIKCPHCNGKGKITTQQTRMF